MKPTFENEKLLSSHCVMGVDEVGYGAWAGPVVVGVAAMDLNLIPSLILHEINDSKSLTSRKRESIYESLIVYSGKGLYFCMQEASNQEVDEMNVRAATYLAMKRAVKELLNLYQEISWGGILVDGMHAPPLPLKTHCLISGDKKSFSIATASILAKVTRDRFMQTLSKEYPHYGWDKNVGYGTRRHQEGLKDFGPSPYHRMTYKPLQKFIK